MADHEYSLPPTADARDRASRTQRLKDTCDMCSASKIKCDKKKPICTRCERLQYPCFYSPARRVPRRRGSQAAPSSSSADKQESADRQLFRDGSSQTVVDGHATTMREAFVGQPRKTAAATTRPLSLSEKHELLPPRTAPSSTATAIPLPSQHGPHGRARVDVDIAMFRSPVSVRSSQTDYFDEPVDLDATLTNGYKLYHLAMPPGDNPSTQYLQQNILQNNQNGFSNSCTSHHQSMGSNTHEPATTSTLDPGQDCATMAVNILHYIDTSNKLKWPSHTGVNTHSNLNISMNMIAISIKRVSSMMICSCSKRADVSLLVAAICDALLDGFESILRYTTQSSSSSSLSSFKNGDGQEPYGGEKRNESQKKSINSNGMVVDSSDSKSHEYHHHHVLDRESSNNDKNIMLQLLDELPRVANLVTQFTKRYGQESEPVWRDLAKSLASSMMNRLQTMINEVTNWVAQI